MEKAVGPQVTTTGGGGGIKLSVDSLGTTVVSLDAWLDPFIDSFPAKWNKNG